jgi:hypothetical protein
MVDVKWAFLASRHSWPIMLKLQAPESDAFSCRDGVFLRGGRIGIVWCLSQSSPSSQMEDVIGFHTEDEAERWRNGNGYRA